MNSFRCSLHVPVLPKHDQNLSWNKTVILAMESPCVLAVDLCRVFPKLLAVIGVFSELAIASSLMFHVNNSWVCALLLSSEPFETKVYVGSNRCTLSWVSFLLSQPWRLTTLRQTAGGGDAYEDVHGETDRHIFNADSCTEPNEDSDCAGDNVKVWAWTKEGWDDHNALIHYIARVS